MKLRAWANRRRTHKREVAGSNETAIVVSFVIIH